MCSRRGAVLQRAVLCNVHPDSSLSSNRFEWLRAAAISQTISEPRVALSSLVINDDITIVATPVGVDNDSRPASALRR